MSEQKKTKAQIRKEITTKILAGILAALMLASTVYFLIQMIVA